MVLNVSSKAVYKRNLKRDEQQAFEGARMFYYGVLPVSMVTLLFLIAYLYEDASNKIADSSKYTSSGTQSIMPAFLYLLLASVSYGFAVRFYHRCNQIEVYPVISDESETLELSNEINSESAISNRSAYQDDCSVLTRKKLPQKYFCQICNRLCEYRTHHCRKCGACIERYDHHCFWIGNCVGRHNHKFFYLFLLCQSLNNFCELKTFLQTRRVILELEIVFPLIVWVIFYLGLSLCLGFLVFTGYLATYHSMLICLSLTTWEQMRRQKISYLKYLPKGYNPFSVGVAGNIKKFFTEPTRHNDPNVQIQNWDDFLPDFEEAKTIEPGFNLIDNKYYSCC